jgi:hypothetical protein
MHLYLIHISEAIQIRFLNFYLRPRYMFLNNILSIFNITFPEQMVTFKRNSKVPCSNNWFNFNLQKMRETLGLVNDAYKLHETIEIKHLLSRFKKKISWRYKGGKNKSK